MNDKPKLYIITGDRGTGKTLFALHLAQSCKTCVLCTEVSTAALMEMAVMNQTVIFDCDHASGLDSKALAKKYEIISVNFLRVK